MQEYPQMIPRVCKETWVVLEVIEPLCCRPMDVVKLCKNSPTMGNENPRVENPIMLWTNYDISVYG